MLGFDALGRLALGQLPAAPVSKGWLVPLSVAPRHAVAVVVAGLVLVPAPPVSVPTNTVTIDKWQQRLSQAAPVAKAIQGYASVPFNTVQTVNNTTTIDKWQQPLSVAVATVKAQAGLSVVPLNTPQVAAAPFSFAWYVQLSVAPRIVPALQGASFVPFDTAQTTPPPPPPPVFGGGGGGGIDYRHPKPKGSFLVDKHGRPLSKRALEKARQAEIREEQERQERLDYDIALLLLLTS